MTQPNPVLASPTPLWQRELAEAVKDPAELVKLLELGEEWLTPAQRAAEAFPLRAPRSYIARMRRSDPFDPLLRQVLPLAEELVEVPGYGADPVGDLAAGRGGGVLHKYHGRVLLVATGACAIHCRYCFRRHYPYTESIASRAEWQEALAYIRARPDLEEVILSGGDPLSLADRRLLALTEGLNEIPHVQRLRVHSRLPIVLPSRITDEMLSWFAGTRLRPIMVVHANHAQELNGETASALSRLRDAGATLLNQTVLLRGINDSADALAALSERLFDQGVLPYYLHLLDRVQGAAHFDVEEAQARLLLAALSARLPGYLVPKLVREEAGAPNKTLLQ